jgi:hypothetical protein
MKFPLRAIAERLSKKRPIRGLVPIAVLQAGFPVLYLTSPPFRDQLLACWRSLRGAAGKRGEADVNGVLRAGLAGLCLAGSAIAAWASETISYTYDARGRLVKVVRSGSVNSNVSANYGYDKADNRTNVNVVSPNPPPQ